MASFLGGAMRALSRSPKTSKFVDTLNHADLPRGWSDDPEIQRMAFEAWRNMRFESPFFRAFYKNSKLVDEAGRPIVFYHGSRSPELDAIDPDMSRLMRQQGSGSSFAARNPVTALAYVARPGAKLDDPLYQNFRRTVEDALLAGQDFTVPDRHGLGMKTIGMGPVALRSPKDSPDFYLHELEKSIADDEWKRGAARLSAAYEAMKPGHAVPQDILDDAVSGRHGYARFLEDNSDVLGFGGPEDIFSHRELGKIYPVYINAERPLVVEGRPGAVDWAQTGRMALNRDYLLPSELERLDLLPKNVADVARGYDTPARLYPSVDYSRVPTDALSAHLRMHTDHDALWSRGVRDGGGAHTPVTDVVAFHSPLQAKAAAGPVIGTFDPNQRSMFRGVLPYVMAGGALAAPSAAEARLRERDLPVEEAWNPLEALALAPVGAASLAGAAGSFLADAAMGLAPDIPEVPEEYYEAAQ